MAEDPRKQEVIVTDIHMPFGSMIVFMVKWAIASIPAFLILIVIGAFAWGTILGLVLSARSPSSRAISPSANAPSPGLPPARAEGTTATASYIQRVAVRGVEVGKSTLGQKGVFGEIKNEGDRVLSKVQITIYCLDALGRPIFEKTYHPVLEGGFSFGDTSQPLKPGYSRKFGVKLDDAPSDWSGKVDVKVTDIAFSDAAT